MRHAQASDVSPGTGTCTDKLSNWGPRAEYLGQSLDTYTPAPSNPSFTGALHPPRRQAAETGRLSIFRAGFELRCIQLLSEEA